MPYAISDAFVNAVPVGADNAQRAYEIWRRFDCDGLETVRKRLVQLSRDGLIHRAMRSAAPQNDSWFYWREPGAQAVENSFR